MIEALNLLEQIERSSIAMFLKDSHGRYAYINRAGASMLGRSVSGVLDRDDRDLFDAKSADLMIRRDAEILSTRNARAYDSLARVDDAWKLFHTAKVGLRSGSGPAYGLIGISADVTFGRSAQHTELILAAREAMSAKPLVLERAMLKRGLEHSILDCL